MNQRVSISVNGRAATFFLGLTVRHAIGARAARAVREGRAEVRDRDGNLVGLEGALYDGQALVVCDLAAAAPSPRSNTASAQKRLRQRVQERLLDDESLRAGLSDEEARVLLSWATAQLEAWITAPAQRGDDVDALRAPLQRVSAVMRGMARLVCATGGEETNIAADALATLLARSGAALDGASLVKEKSSLSGAELARKLAALADGFLPRPSGRA